MLFIGHSNAFDTSYKDKATRRMANETKDQLTNTDAEIILTMGDRKTDQNWRRTILPSDDKLLFRSC